MAKSSFSLFYMKASFILKLLVENRRMTLKQINHEWLKNPHGDGREIDYKSFGRYRDAIADVFGIEILKIPIQAGYCYSIENPRDLESNELLIWTLNMFSIGETILKAQPMHDRIIVQDFPSTNGHLPMVIEAMHDNITVSLVYQKYKFAESKEHTIQIYCMMQYGPRLYVVGKTEWGGICTFSLDRIVDMKLTDERFKTPGDFNARKHFKDAYGVVADKRKWPAVRVVLRAYDDEPDYMIDTPVHRSQKIVQRTDEYTDFEFYIGLTNDFIGHILERGDRIQVLSPKVLVDEVRRRMDATLSRYSDPVED